MARFPAPFDKCGLEGKSSEEDQHQPLREPAQCRRFGATQQPEATPTTLERAMWRGVSHKATLSLCPHAKDSYRAEHCG